MKLRNLAKTTTLLTLLFLSYFSVIASNIDVTEPITLKGIEHPTQTTLAQVATNLSRPILESVTFQNGSSVSMLRERNDSLGLGAIVKADLFENYTLTYLVVNGTQETRPLLHINIPGVNSTLDYNNKTAPAMEYVSTENKTEFVLPYDLENPLVNVTVSKYRITFNLTAEYAIFYAEVNGVSEDADQIRNMFSLDVSPETEAVDDFYIQNENVTITLSGKGHNPNATYGIQWRVSTSSLYKIANFTSVNVNTTSGEFNATLDLGSFDPGRSIIWRTIVFIFDNARNHTVLLSQFDTQSVDVGDGTPELGLTFEIPHEFPIINKTVYTNNPTLFINASALVPKGNITSIEVKIVDLSNNGTQVIKSNSNQTSINETLEMNKDFEIQITAYTDKNLNASEKYTVITDAVAPTIKSFSTDFDGAVVTRFNKTVTFTFDFEDDHSGIRIATLDLGNGVSVEVTGMKSFTYTYNDFDVYEAKLEIWDEAGNKISSSLLFTISEPELPQKGALFDPVWGTFMGIVILGLIAYVVYSFIQRRE